MNARLALGCLAVLAALSCGPGRNEDRDLDPRRSADALRDHRELEVKLEGFVLDVRGDAPAVPLELEALADAPGKKLVALSKKTAKAAAQGGKPSRRTKLPAPAPRRPDGEKGKKWIVQFAGPIHASDRQALVEAGARVGDYLPDFAFLVAMDEPARRRVERLPNVHGVARYKPAYKIARGLKGEDGSVREDREKIRVHVRVERAEDLPLALGEVHRAKGKVLDVRADVARAEVDPATIAQLAQLEEVLWVEEAIEPIALNDTSRWTIQTFVPESTRISDQGLLGQGEIVGVGDTGLDVDMCWFRDPTGAPIGPGHRKVVGYASFTDDSDGNFGHGTHVSGTVAGDQTPITGASTANGMAPAARLFMTDLTPGESNGIYVPSDLGELFVTPYQAGARLHTNSWGANNNAYDTFAWSVDRFMWEHPDFLALFANGNSGPGEASVGTPANAKNAVSVGATENGVSAENMAWFSSNGPTRDGRVKPTVSAPGWYVVSADSDGVKGNHNCGTTAYSGTSMATPTVAGAAALVRQYYVQGWYPTGAPRAMDAFSPSAALVKASLMSAAQNMTGADVDGPIPATGQGWGRINLSNVLRFTGDLKSLEVLDVTEGLETGESWSRRFFASGDQPLKVTLAWTDREGSTAATKALVNDLDLAVTAPGGAITWLGNAFSGGASGAGGAADRVNVEEQVLLLAPAPGAYTVSVTGFNVPSGPQPFAIVVTGAGGVSAFGDLGLDRQRYNASAEMLIRVADTDLNADPSRAEEVTVPVRSTSEPGGEAVRLVETAPDSSIFAGRIPLAPTPAIAADGHLQVANGDALTATYDDANDGTGVSRTATATAVADLVAPVLSGAGPTGIRQDSAYIASTTSEPALVSVEYGETPALGAATSETWPSTQHLARLAGLREATTYHYALVATDVAGNVAHAPIGTFTTANEPPELEIYSSNSTETYRPETVIFGTATDPSGPVSITINGAPVAWRQSDGAYELSVTLAPGPNSFTVVATDALGNVASGTIPVTRLDPPDLVLDSIVGPPRGGMSELIPIAFTICNRGIGTALWSGWTGFYLSPDPEYSVDDVEFDWFVGVGDAIEPGQCVPVAGDIRTPPWVQTVGNTYWFGGYADAFDDLWESDETNNDRADGRITIDGPDLLLTGLSAPTSVGTATQFTVTGTATNRGPGAAYRFDVLFYLSTDSTITPDDRVLGGWSSGFMYAGRSEAVSRALTVPDDVAAGRYHLGAIVDPGSLLIESDETNNVFVIGPLDVLGPDLVVSEVSGPPAARTGDTIVLHDVVTARPTGGAASYFDVGIYLSDDPFITTSDVRIALRHVEGLASGESSAADTTLTIPRTLAGGTFFLGAIVDASGAVAETDDANNALAGGTFTLTGPDLVLVSASAPTAGVTGGTVTVESTVAAAADGGFAPEFFVGVFFSTDPVITASDTLLGWRPVPALAPGESSTGATTVALPTGLAPGTYFLGVIADDFWVGGCDEWETCWEAYDGAKEPTGANNAALAAAISIAGPDITVAEVSAPEVGFTGRPLVVRNTVSTSGGGTGPFELTFYLSSDTVITDSDVRLGSRTVFALPPGGSSTEDTALTVPVALAPGPWFVGAIADRWNGVVETVESNNARAGNAVSIRGSNLVVSGMTGPTAAVTSASFDVTTTVRNMGEGSSPATIASVYLSTDATITTSDLRLAYRSVPSLAPGEQSTATTPVSIPSNVAPGTYHLGAIVDPHDGVRESSDADNTFVTGPLAVSGPDLFISSASAPSQALTGESITVQQTIAAGPGGGASWATVGIFLSTSLAGTPQDAYLGARSVSSLPAGGSSAGSTAVTIPPTLPGGTYYVRVVADPWRSVAESDEGNNALVAGTLEVTGPDLVAVAVSGPSTADRGATITVSDTVIASATGGAAPELYVGIFLSSDPDITAADRLVATRWVAGLAPGASTSASTAVVIPFDLAPGTYYLGMIVDDFAVYIGDELDGYYVVDNAKESDEGNNAVSGGIIVIGVPGA